MSICTTINRRLQSRAGTKYWDYPKLDCYQNYTGICIILVLESVIKPPLSARPLQYIQSGTSLQLRRQTYFFKSLLFRLALVVGWASSLLRLVWAFVVSSANSKSWLLIEIVKENPLSARVEQSRTTCFKEFSLPESFDATAKKSFF